MKTLFSSLLLLSLVAFNAAQTTLNPNIQPNIPYPNSVVLAASKLNVQYFIIGSKYTQAASTASNPTSLSLDFHWTSKLDSSVHTLSVEHDLPATASSSPEVNRTYNYAWTVPGCHFFTRYPSTSYTYSFSFTPVYNQESNKLQVSQGTPVVLPFLVSLNTTNAKC